MLLRVADPAMRRTGNSAEGHQPNPHGDAHVNPYTLTPLAVGVKLPYGRHGVGNAFDPADGQ